MSYETWKRPQRKIGICSSDVVSGGTAGASGIDMEEMNPVDQVQHDQESVIIPGFISYSAKVLA